MSQLERVIGRLEAAGLTVKSEVRLRDDSGTRLRLDNGSSINVLDNGKVRIGKTNAEAVRVALGMANGQSSVPGGKAGSSAGGSGAREVDRPVSAKPEERIAKPPSKAPERKPEEPAKPEVRKTEVSAKPGEREAEPPSRPPDRKSEEPAQPVASAKAEESKSAPSAKTPERRADPPTKPLVRRVEAPVKTAPPASVRPLSGPRVRIVGKQPAGDLAGNKVFVTYGKDRESRNQLEALLRRWGIEALSVEKLPTRGATVLEKLEAACEDVHFAIVVATPDEEGHPSGRPDEKVHRASANVVFQLGMLLARLGRENVVVMLQSETHMERPSDIHGLTYLPFYDDLAGDAGVILAKTMKSRGYEIDLSA